MDSKRFLLIVGGKMGVEIVGSVGDVTVTFNVTVQTFTVTEIRDIGTSIRI